MNLIFQLLVQGTITHQEQIDLGKSLADLCGYFDKKVVVFFRHEAPHVSHNEGRFREVECLSDTAAIHPAGKGI